MACDCETYTCLEAFINPCSAGTELNIIPTADATWNARIEFNGTWIFFGFEVNNGLPIVLPTVVFNEDYVHELRVIDEDGIQTCYRVRSVYQRTLTGFEPQPPISQVWQWGQLAVSGNTVSDLTLGGELAPIMWINEQPIDWAAQGIIHAGDELDFTSIGGVFGTIIYQYRNL